MQLGSTAHSGQLKIAYKTTREGPLKWDLDFYASDSGHYRLTYTWSNTTRSSGLSASSRQFRVGYAVGNYTFSWSDVPSLLNTTADASAGRFLLTVDLGTLSAGALTRIDPSIVSTSGTVPTPYTFQRKVFYEPRGGNYWVFYDNYHLPTYQYSSDGIHWSGLQSMPPGWPAFYDVLSSAPSVYASGQTVVVATGQTSQNSGSSASASLYYVVGTISGSTISWAPVSSIPVVSHGCNNGSACVVTVGVRFVNVIMGSDGRLAFSFNEFVNSQDTSCSTSSYSESYVKVSQGPQTALVEGHSGCGSFDASDDDASVILPADSQGRLRVIYDIFNGSVWELHARWLFFSPDGLFYTLSGSLDPAIDTSLFDFLEWSSVSDANYGSHIVYRTSDGSIRHAYSNMTSSWSISRDIFAGSASYPTLTVDYSTNDVYALGIKFLGANYSSIVMRAKSSTLKWSDRSMVFPVTGRILAGYLGSNFASGGRTSSNQIQMIWSEMISKIGPQWNLLFASVPIQTIWSPYSSPSDPWDGNGLAPYGQYFSNLGEYVSTSTGMLTLRQTDLSVPGRGLNLEITRVYTEPYSFLGNAPYNYEKYPWAPMGDGWQFNFPWLNNTNYPLYIHLWDGEGYRIPSSFWSGITASFENHQGEHFRLVRNTNNSTVLYTKTGVSFVFDSTHRLNNITDATGSSNTIAVNYSSNLISCMTDTVGRAFRFSYSSGLLQNVSQVSGSCTSPGTSVRSVLYGNNGQSLTSSTDPASRITSYQYQATGSSGITSWLLSRITYPTKWYSNYTYIASLMGTQAYSYRVSKQYVGSTSNLRTREFDYQYWNGAGDQINNSTITSFDQTAPVSFTAYQFSFSGVTWNVSDSNHGFVRGVSQRFGANGEIPREVIIVTPTQGYTNYYRYDLWGNQIYSRRVINPSANWYHESFNAYYNDGLPPAFNAFQDTFSQNQRTAPDNPWNVQNGNWQVQNSVFNGTETSGAQENTFASADINKADVSLQARVYLNRQVNQTAGYTTRVGIFSHYNSHTALSYKWALVLVNVSSVMTLRLLDEYNVWLPSTPCTISLHTWYTFNMTVHGTNATGWASAQGQSPCSISGKFSSSSPAVGGTGFGLYAGGYSTLFANVTVTTVSPSITTTGFSNSFIKNGAPNSYIKSALAGVAELQNGTGSAPIETYYSYSSSGHLSQTKQLYSSVSGVQWLSTSRTYDTYGNLVTLTDPLGNNITYAYSSTYSYAYLTSQTQTLIPGNTVITSSYSYNFTMGTMLFSVDPNGQTRSYQYDILGRVTRVSYPNSLGFVSYAYNDTANYVDVTNENGWHTRQIYDGLGRSSTVERFSGSSFYSNQTSTYNWMDKVATRTDPLNNVYSYQYDVLGRTTMVAKPDGNATSTLYVDVNPSVQVFDENGYWKSYGYDRLGRLLWVMEWQCPPSIRCQTFASYSYDEVGNLRTITTSNSQSTTYKYDNLNRLVQTTYPDGTFESYTYDNNGNLVTKTDRKGVRTAYAYDSLNRIITITYQGSSITSDNYSYDSNSNLTQLRSQNATLTYGYDARNRVTSEAYSVNSLPPPPPGGSGGGGGGKGCPCKTGPISNTASSGSTPAGIVSASYTVSYAYNGETLSSIGYPDGHTAIYSYDNLGRVLAVSNGTINYATFSYYQNDQIKGAGFGNGLVANYTYDALARPQNITVYNGSNKLLSLLYSYNKTGTVASVNGQINTVAVSEQYKYDPLQRLTNATLIAKGKTTTIWYEYDNVGNRLRQSLNGITTYNYNRANNELTTANVTGTVTAYSYDLDGNLNTTTSGTTQSLYYWDVPGHLLKVSSATAVQGFYAYDGLGRRVEAKEGSSTTFYAYEGTETLYEQLASGVVNDYIYAGGMRIARVSGIAVSYFHTDALGSTRLVTDSSKTVLFTDSYQPFGQDNSSTGNENYKFTGKPVSQTTGLYYEYQRWYDPSIGRFISPDPKHGKLSSPQSLNLYVYVLGRPTSLTDPSGLDACGWSPLTWGGCASNAGQSVSNWWNSQDQSTKLAIIAVVVTVAIVATAGIAAPALIPLIATGIAIGAGTSVASYAASTVASGGSITASGLFKSASIGAFFGAVSFGTFGAVAGIAASAGLGSLASTALGLVASFGVTSALQGSGGSDSSDGISQLTKNFANAASNRLQTMSQVQGNTPACTAGIEYGVGAIAAGGVVMSLGAHSFEATSDMGPRARLVSWAIVGVGFSLVAGGLAYSISQCG